MSQSPSISWRGALPRVCCPSFAAAQDLPHHLDLAAGEGFVLLHATGWNNWRDDSQAVAPEYCTDSRLKHNPSLSVEEAYLLVLERRPEV